MPYLGNHYSPSIPQHIYLNSISRVPKYRAALQIFGSQDALHVQGWCFDAQYIVAHVPNSPPRCACSLSMTILFHSSCQHPRWHLNHYSKFTYISGQQYAHCQPSTKKTCLMLKKYLNNFKSAWCYTYGQASMSNDAEDIVKYTH